MDFCRELFRNHLAYSAWASKRLVSAAAELSPEELSRDFGTAHKSILGTLVHIFGSDRLWLARLRKSEYPPHLTPDDYHFQVLQTEWPTVHERWLAWFDSLSSDALSAPVTYTDLKGRQWSQPLWQPILHVVNHGTHHRGQVSGFLRAVGYTPPPLDLAFFQRHQDLERSA
jgi:uncharacterized damage-inducible protein DinB